MKLSVFISVLAIGFNITTIVGQSSNNLIISDFQTLTQQLNIKTSTTTTFTTTSNKTTSTTTTSTTTTNITTTTTTQCLNTQTLNQTSCIRQNQSLLYIFANYQKRFSITSYGGNVFETITGFEQVVTNGIPTYYVVDYNRVIQFDQYWNYVKYNDLPYDYSYHLKYVNGYFFISADNYFYKTDTNFNRIASYNTFYVFYFSIYYDSSSLLFYVSGDYRGVSIFDTNCFSRGHIDFGGYSSLYALRYFNGNLYGDKGDDNSIIVASQETGEFVDLYNNVCPDIIVSITIDSFGYMAVSCNGGLIALYNANNGTYLNQIAASYNPYYTDVDASGRFVSIGSNVLDIYY